MSYMLKQITKDTDIVQVGYSMIPEVCLLRYLKNMKRVSIEDINKREFELKKEAYIYRSTYRNFVKQYEKKWGLKFKHFNVLQQEEVRREFKKVYTKLKKNGGE